MWEKILAFVGLPIARNVLGYIENALKKNESYNFRKLLETIFRVGVLSVATYFGFNSAGVEVSEIGAGFLAILEDFILHALKKREVKEVKEK